MRGRDCNPEQLLLYACAINMAMRSGPGAPPTPAGHTEIERVQLALKEQRPSYQ